MAFDNVYLQSWNDGTATRRARYSHPTDVKATIEAAGYFTSTFSNPSGVNYSVYAGLPVGTIIDVTSPMTGTPLKFSGVVTASPATGSITIMWDN